MRQGPPLKRFYLLRRKDVSGVSGTGVVAHGVLFQETGMIAIFWGTGREDAKPSCTIWNSIEDAKAVHGHGGHTEFIWEDE